MRTRKESPRPKTVLKTPSSEDLSTRHTRTSSFFVGVRLHYFCKYSSGDRAGIQADRVEVFFVFYQDEVIRRSDPSGEVSCHNAGAIGIYRVRAAEGKETDPSIDADVVRCGEVSCAIEGLSAYRREPARSRRGATAVDFESVLAMQLVDRAPMTRPWACAAEPTRARTTRANEIFLMMLCIYFSF